MTSDAIIAAIPARYASTRLPGKPLLEIHGRPMIEHVYRRALEAGEIERVVVLTDDERIAEAVDRFGGHCEMTPPECPSGTDRIAHAARNWDAAGVVNVQGDEPLIDPGAIEAVARHLRNHPGDPMVTLAAPVEDDDFENPNTVKVVLDRRGYALYFSRAPIPYPRNPHRAPQYKHIGLYGYRKETLLHLASLAPTLLEQSEALEQLRALEHGIPIRVLETTAAEPGVDTPEDLSRVRSRLTAR